MSRSARPERAVAPELHELAHPLRSRLTLVELVVVIAILGGLTTVVGVNLGAGDAHRLELVEQQIRLAAKRARDLAAMTHAPHGVLFDVARDRLGIVDQHGALVTDPTSAGAWVVDTREGRFGSVDITAADFGSARKAAIFDAQGVPLAGGSVSLRSGDMLRVLELDPATGLFSTP